MSPKAAAKIQKLKKLKAKQTEQPRMNPRKRGSPGLVKTHKTSLCLIEKEIVPKQEPEEDEIQSLKDIEDRYRTNENVCDI